MSRNIYLNEDIALINKKFEASDDVTIFRYMDFSKFMDLLENKSIYFCSSEYFEDNYEGKMPEGFYKNWPEDITNGHKEISTEFEKVYKTYISCWNEAKGESYALWKIYTNPNTGVAIKSTVGDLKKALNNDRIKIYKVRYIDSFSSIDEDYEPPFYFRETEREPNISINKRIKEVYKFKSYKYEDEIRAVYVDISKSRGKTFEIDINKLINEIYISPFAPDWFAKLVEKIKSNKNYNILDKPIYKSQILIRGNND